MPSKLTNIFGAGGVVLITANEGSTLYKLVSNYKMGLLVPQKTEPHYSKELPVHYRSQRI